ncbi:unnamed protein product [Owenia fusiformis]|uniref:Uridine diphosphate glucose pyrophosphatase NUDT14 n=1 Tax=Owenia fusiformis TaxID=6347 RepID=A0A8S4PF09_OWEFU|nr:unnamed protein product [Owenia fusiformis]
MEKISDVTIQPCSSTPYIKPLRITYTQDGVKKIWDAMKVHDSVCVLLYNKSRDCFVFVRQFRPAVYINSVVTEKQADGTETVDSAKYPGTLGLSYECCAGIVDKDCSLVEIAKMEVLEECGYDVPLENIQKITSYKAGAGTTGSTQTFFYAHITDNMKVSQGGGLVAEGELIDVVEIPVKDGKQWILDESINKPTGLMFAVMWFYTQHAV